MEDKPLSYDWASYYQSAYEKEKKKNTILAGKIADAEVKEEELSLSLRRIESNILWKMSAPARKIYHVLSSKKGASAKPKRAPESEDEKGIAGIYRQELFRQKHPYLQWISENEKTTITKEMSEQTMVDGWKKIELENTDLCIIMCGRGIMNENAGSIIKAWFEENTNCVFAYADEDYYWRDLSNRMHPWYKPCWSPDTMLSFCYPGHMIIVRKSSYPGLLGQGHYETGSYADFYDLCLRLEERAFTLEECDRLAETLKNRKKVVHDRVGNIEHVLFHNCYEPGDAARKQIEEEEHLGGDVLELVENLLKDELENGRDMTGCDASYLHVREAALKRRGIKARLETGADPDIYHVRYDMDGKNSEYPLSRGGGMVSVIIPSKDNPELLESCLFSFQERTAYKNYEWIVVDNGSSSENRSRIEVLREKYGFIYIYEPMEFNFSAMCNIGAEKAQGKYLLFMNDDIEIIQKDWLGIMLGQASRPHVGAVGAKLWYAGSSTIQHVGITNMAIGPSHKLTTLADDRNYYYGRNLLTYDMIGVTAACLMIDRRKYREAGGMDDRIKVAYNDVDLCFRLIEAGYYNVLRNDAVLYHHESVSRGPDMDDADKWDRLLAEKEQLYSKHPEMRGKDAFYHNDLIDDDLDYICNMKADFKNKEKLSDIITVETAELDKAKQHLLKLTVDKIEDQIKSRSDEEEILIITGWSYIPGEDNARYSRRILLRNENGILYQSVPCAWHRKDVEKVLTGEVNVSLAGFVLRFEKNRLEKGHWQIGMLAEDTEQRKKALAWADEAIEI